MRILITGASGFIGGHLALALGQDGKHQIMSVCGRNPCASQVTRISEQVHRLDLTVEGDVGILLSSVAPEVIIHAAALARTDSCEKDPRWSYLSNVVATEHIVACAENLRNKPYLIYLSTDLVFDGGCAPANGFTENDTPTPRSVYAKSKYRAEQIVQSYPGVNTVLRICLAYGKPVGRCKGCLGWLVQGLSGKQAVNLFVDEWRTPLLVDDLSVVVQRLLKKHCDGEKCWSGSSSLFHVAGTERISRYEFGLRVAEFYRLDADSLVAKRQEEMHTLAPRASDVSLSTEKLQTQLGICTHDVRSGLECLR